MKELEARGIVERHVSDGHADQGLLRADREGPRARARDGRAEGLGGPLVGLTSTARPTVTASRSISLHAAMADRPQTADDVKALVEENNIRFVRLWFTDILGQLKSFSISAEQLDDAFEGGMGFDGSSITGFNAIEESDMIARAGPDDVQRAAVAPGGRRRRRAHVRRRPDARAPPLRGRPAPRPAPRRGARARDGLRRVQRRPRARVLPVPRQPLDRGARRGRLLRPHDARRRLRRPPRHRARARAARDRGRVLPPRGRPVASTRSTCATRAR